MQWIRRKVNVTPSGVIYFARDQLRLYVEECQLCAFFLRNLHIYITSDISFLLHVVKTFLDTAPYDTAENILIYLYHL